REARQTRKARARSAHDAAPSPAAAARRKTGASFRGQARAPAAERTTSATPAARVLPSRTLVRAHSRSGLLLSARLALSPMGNRLPRAADPVRSQLLLRRLGHARSGGAA